MKRSGPAPDAPSDGLPNSSRWQIESRSDCIASTLFLAQPREILHVKVVQRRRSGRKQDKAQENPSFGSGQHQRHKQVEKGELGKESDKRPLQFGEARLHDQAGGQQHGSPIGKHSRLSDDLERFENRRISQQEPLDYQAEKAKQKVVNQPGPALSTARADALACEKPNQEQHPITKHGAAKCPEIMPSQKLIQNFTRGRKQEPQQNED